MDNSSARDHSYGEMSVESRKSLDHHHCGPSPVQAAGGYRLFDRKSTIHQIIGGGRAADVILWKQHQISFCVIVVATVAWLLVERSGLSFLTISSDILLILIVIQFIRANSAVMLNRQLKPLPELVLSEEMVNNAAASFRVKVNNMLLMAHDITLGKDFRLFFKVGKVVVFLWLLSVIGSFFSFFTLAYIGIILSFTIPALYNKYEERVDRCAGVVHQKLSKHYRIVDEKVIQRLPRSFSRKKAA